MTLSWRGGGSIVRADGVAKYRCAMYIMRMRVALVILVIALSGCGTVGFKNESAVSGRSNSATGAGMFEPDAMRIHPVSRIAVDGGTGLKVVEAYIEFVDRFGDVTKASGVIRFEAYAQANTAASSDGGYREDVWDISIDDEESNRRHYDPITRSYAFKLKLASSLSSEDRITISTLFNSSAGTRLNDTKTLTLSP